MNVGKKGRGKGRAEGDDVVTSSTLDQESSATEETDSMLCAPLNITKRQAVEHSSLCLSPLFEDALNDDVPDPAVEVPEGDAQNDLDLFGPLRLFDLPQEIQDRIFTLAYPETESLSIVPKTSWESRQEHTRKLGKVPRPFARKVDEGMVSKRYFRMAAKAWMTAQKLAKFSQVKLWQSALYTLLDQKCDIFMDYAKEAHVRMFPSRDGWAFRGSPAAAR